MKIRNSLKSAKLREKGCRIVRRRGRIGSSNAAFCFFMFVTMAKLKATAVSILRSPFLSMVCGGCLPVGGEQFGFAVTAPQQNITGLDDAVRIGQQIAGAV